MKYKLKVYSIWEFGQRKDAQGCPHQEDSLFPAYGEQKDTDRLFILCDGMGGHDSGEIASATVCEAMSKSVLKNTPDPEGWFSDEILHEAINEAFDALDKKDNGAEKKMGTTMTFLKLHDAGCTIAHMGDSRVYHIRPGENGKTTEILFETKDHSLVNELIRIGELTPEEAKFSRKKNVITRAMQPNMVRKPKADIYHSADIRPGDYFYICSDGMLEQMENEHIRFNFSEMTGDDENKVFILTQATSQNRDNHTGIIVHILDVINTSPVKGMCKTTDAASNTKPITVEITGNKEMDTNLNQDFDNGCSENRVLFYRNKHRKNNILLRFIICIIFMCLVIFGAYKVSSYFKMKNYKRSQTMVAHPNRKESETSELLNNRGGDNVEVLSSDLKRVQAALRNSEK